MTRDIVAENIPVNTFAGNIPVFITINTVKQHETGEFYCI